MLYSGRKLEKEQECYCVRSAHILVTGDLGTGTEGFHGFVVSVAIVQNLQMQMHSPSEA